MSSRDGGWYSAQLLAQVRTYVIMGDPLLIQRPQPSQLSKRAGLASALLRFGLEQSSLWKAVLGVVGFLAASLVSTEQCGGSLSNSEILSFASGAPEPLP